MELSACRNRLFRSPSAVHPPSAALSGHITLDALQKACQQQQQHLEAATKAGTLKNIGSRSQARLPQHIVDGLGAAQALLGQDNTEHRTRNGGEEMFYCRERRVSP